MSDPNPKKVELAIQLLKLGVSQAGVTELLSYPVEVIERQLALLPLRGKIRRPAAYIVEAIRLDYSAPNIHSHASRQNHPTPVPQSLDENSQPPY